MNKYEIVATNLEQITPKSVAQFGVDVEKILDNSLEWANKLYGEEKQIHLEKIANLKNELDNLNRIIDDGEITKEEKMDFVNKADALYQKIDLEHNELLKILNKRKIATGTFIAVQVAIPTILKAIGMTLQIKSQSVSNQSLELKK